MALHTLASIKPIIIALSLALGSFCQASSGPQDVPVSDTQAPAASTPERAPVAVATTLGLYAQVLGGSHFEASHLELKDNGYTVESGKLVSDDGREEGALVMVRASDGALTAIVSREGKNGLLQVNANGERTFTAEPDHDWLNADTLPGEESASVSSPAATTEPVVIDALVGFTQEALSAVNVNPVAFALAQLETANLSLNNSELGNIQLQLAGIQIYDEAIPSSSAGLSRWEVLLRPLRPQYKHDINVGFSIGGGFGGVAYMPGYTSVNLITAVTAFKHELGHNVGGNHCSAGADNYKFGYATVDNNVKTNLCGNSIYYYSNPAITVSGHKIGDARTADMARLWREQVSRLSGYSVAYDGVRLVHVGEFSMLNFSASSPLSRPYFVALDPSVGPTQPEDITKGVTRLNVPVKAKNGHPYTVVMTGACKSAINTRVPMHSLHGCNLASETQFFLYFEKDNNPELPAGWYNGTFELKLVSPDGDKKVLVSVSVNS